MRAKEDVLGRGDNDVFEVLWAKFALPVRRSSVLKEWARSLSVDSQKEARKRYPKKVLELVREGFCSNCECEECKKVKKLLEGGSEE